MSPLREAPTGLPPCLWHPPWRSCTWLLTVLTPDNAFRVKRKKTPERHTTLLTSRTDVDGACRPAWDEGLDVLERKPCVQSRYSHTCSSVCISKDRTGSSLDVTSGVTRKEIRSVNVESSEHLSLTAKEGAILSPCPGDSVRPRRCVRGLHTRVPPSRPKPLCKNTILLTHGNEKTFSLLFNHQSVSGFRIHLKEII